MIFRITESVKRVSIVLPGIGQVCINGMAPSGYVYDAEKTTQDITLVSSAYNRGLRGFGTYGSVSGLGVASSGVTLSWAVTASIPISKSLS